MDQVYSFVIDYECDFLGAFTDHEIADKVANIFGSSAIPLKILDGDPSIKKLLDGYRLWTIYVYFPASPTTINLVSVSLVGNHIKVDCNEEWTPIVNWQHREGFRCDRWLKSREEAIKCGKEKLRELKGEE